MSEAIKIQIIADCLSSNLTKHLDSEQKIIFLLFVALLAAVRIMGKETQNADRATKTCQRWSADGPPWSAVICPMYMLHVGANCLAQGSGSGIQAARESPQPLSDRHDLSSVIFAFALR